MMYERDFLINFTVSLIDGYKKKTMNIINLKLKHNLFMYLFF